MRLFVQPRLWAEEGSQYIPVAYFYAHSGAWYHGVTNFNLGYFNLVPAGAATIATNILPVTAYPYLTTVVALMVQMLPTLLILRHQLLRSMWHKALAIMIVSLAYGSDEVWINTVNSQFFLGLSTLLILLDHVPQSRRWRYLYRGIIVVGGLTGPISSILTPLFILIALAERQKERIVQTGLLSACALIQVFMVLSHQFGSQTLRTTGLNLENFVLALWNHSVVSSLAGEGAARSMFTLIDHYHNTDAQALLVSLINGLLLLIFIGLGALLKRRSRLILLGSYLLFALTSFIGALATDKYVLTSPRAGNRYYFTLNVILLLMLLLISIDARTRLIRISAGTLLALALIVSIPTFFTAPVYDPAVPSWQHEIALWQQDHSYKPKIMPNGWTSFLVRQPTQP